MNRSQYSKLLIHAATLADMKRSHMDLYCKHQLGISYKEFVELVRKTFKLDMNMIP